MIWQPLKATLRLLPVILLALTSYSQVTTGAITGTVFDQTGAAVPGVSLKLTSEGTGEVRTQSTAAGGEYRFIYLPVGQYELRVEASGFTTIARQNITVLVAETERVDFTLKPGTTSQTVEVTGTPPPLEMESPKVGGVIEHKSIVNLPLNGRNFLNLVALEPGAISTAKLPGGGESFITTIHGGNFSLYGSPAEDTEYLLDGITVRDNLGTNVMVRPIVDSIEEFNFQAANYSAAFGNVDGGVINITTRAGTDKFNGGVWEFIRNDVFDARDYFQNAEQVAKKPGFRQNQFGGDLGGPIIKRKLFFYAAYEGFRSAQQVSQAATVPTVAERAGDFSGLAPVFNPFIVDPTTGQRAAFVNNQIPQELWSSQSVAALQRLYPLPNYPGPANNLVEPADKTINYNQVDARGDWDIGSKDHAFVRYIWFHTDRTLPFQFAQLPNFSSVWNSPVQNVALSEVHVFSSNTINDFKVGLNRPGQVLQDVEQNVPVNQQLGIGGTSTMFLGNPNLDISGLSSTGAISNAPNNRTQYDYTVIDNFTHIVGSHSLQWGGGNVWHQVNGGFNPAAHGIFSFDGSLSGQVAGTAIAPGTGNPVADFLLGLPRTSQRCCLDTNGFLHLRRWNLGVYFQDDWKVTPQLTLNLGIRYDYHSITTELNNRISFPDFSAAPSLVLLLAGQNGVSRGVIHPDLTDFAPRFGFAYSFSPKTVIRGGYSVNFDDINQEYSFDQSTNQPFGGAQTFISSPTTPQLTLANAFPEALGTTSSSFGAADPHIRDGYIQHWTLDIQQAVGFGTVLSASYIGNKGSRLVQWGYDRNAPPAGPGAIGPRRTIPSISTVTFTGGGGYSNYSGVAFKAEKRFSSGLSFLAGYVWGKCIDNASTNAIGDGSAAPSFIANDPQYNQQFNRGRCGNDVNQRVNGNFIYALPFGRGRTGLSSVLLGGWQIQSLFDLQTGQPFSVLFGKDNSNTGQGTDRANLVPGQSPNKGPHTPSREFNTSAFTAPQLYSYGSSGRDSVNGPGFVDVDFSVFKSFYPAEGQVISFRAEMFNVLNHTNFFQPSNDFSASAFGTVAGAFEAREIQFGLKYNF